MENLVNGFNTVLKTEESTVGKVQFLLDKLNKIQAKAYEDGQISCDDRAEWRALALDIKWYGYVLRKKAVKNAWGRRVGTIWQAIPADEVPKRTRHFSAELKKIDMRPNDGKPTCKGDCTTRSMSYCLQGMFTYREIEHEQYRLAAEVNEVRGCHRGDGRRKVRRNSSGTWDSIMLDLGYEWMKFNHAIRRDNLAVALRNIEYPVITHSSGHVAVVDKGFVVDSWDSRHGRCDRILIKPEDTDRVLQSLFNCGFIR